MANPLQQASTRRKAIYVGVILGLFFISLFWRGKFAIPLADNTKDGRVELLNLIRRGSTSPAKLTPASSPIHAAADWLQARAIDIQAGPNALDLRELDQGDPEIAASAARLSLVGSRGLVITALWKAAQEKQKRNEWQDLELLVRTVTRLQPNFITPWIYQSWNLSYNVSVENDRLNDMYYYIARGIELLAEGERLNRNSPDMRYQIGFYYANKFGVSDKVITLRSLMQLSVMKPNERNPVDFYNQDKSIRMEEFQRFVKKNPQLVRRLREKLLYTRPEQIVRFLEDNQKVPTRFDKGNNNQLLPAGEQFPVLPTDPPDGEFRPTSETDDSFDAFLAARSWYEYSLKVVPPADPRPSATPRLVGEDRFNYRIPKQPMLILFRQQAPRAQSYYAERLMKEGWFDRTTSWNVDERSDGEQLWFPRDSNERLQTNVSAQTEWAKAYDRWKRHGAENGLDLDQTELTRYSRESQGVPPTFSLTWLDHSDQELATYGVTRAQVEAKARLTYYDQNRNVTNFSFFLESSNAEAASVTVQARKKLWEAEKAKEAGDKRKAIQLYTDGIFMWRNTMLQFPRFHRNERTAKAEEDAAEYHIALAQLLEGDPAIDQRALKQSFASRALIPGIDEADLRVDMARELADHEVGYRVGIMDPALQQRVQQILTDNHPSRKMEKDWPEIPMGKEALIRAVYEREFAWSSEYMDNKSKEDTNRWISPNTMQQTRERLGFKRKAAPAAPAEEPKK